ncbi:MAG: ThuA domain-containing protein [Planctomycetota bacterium]
MMKRTLLLLITGAAVIAGGVMFTMADNPAGEKKKKVLFYSQSFGFPHPVVKRPLTGELSFAEKIIKEIIPKAGYQLFISQDHNDLKNGPPKCQFNKYDAIIFYTSGNPLINRECLIKWLRNGGALIGIHSATDTFKDWPEYVKLIGGSFLTHGPGKFEVTLKIENTTHPATKMLGKEWKLVDEFYHLKHFSRSNVNTLISVDKEKTNLKQQRMKPNKDYPMAWTKEVGKGRVFTTLLGHREDVWTNPLYQQHLLGGIAWALKMDKKPAATQPK